MHNDHVRLCHLKFLKYPASVYMTYSILTVSQFQDIILCHFFSYNVVENEAHCALSVPSTTLVLEISFHL